MKRQNGISKMKSINMGDDNKKKIMVEGLSDSSIERRIYTVRGEHVMIDRDLATYMVLKIVR